MTDRLQPGARNENVLELYKLAGPVAFGRIVAVAMTHVPIVLVRSVMTSTDQQS